jgi:D-alanine-D-alanine ligase-like ATP-grasp enzyme
MENFCGFFSGDIGLDFLLDIKGKPWILEANAKPGRRIVLYSPEIRKQSIQRVLAYAQYLRTR